MSSAAGSIVVRLQALDAPELHYGPGTTLRHLARRLSRRVRTLLATVFRQPHGIDVTARVGAKIGGLGTRVPCVLETFVESPGDVFDTYGRCVADLRVGHGARAFEINDWMLKNGLALPCLFTSLSSAEIERVIEVSRQARRRERGVWRSYRATLPRFPWTLFRARDREADNGPVIMPKIFRIQAAWALARRARLFRLPFERFLTDGPSGATHVHRTDEFVAQGPGASRVHVLSEFIRGARLTVPPDGLVFREAPSELLDRHGKVVTQW